MDRLKIIKSGFVILGVAFCYSAYAVTEIKSIGFAVEGAAGKFSIDASAPITYTRQDYPEEKQIVLDISNAHLSKPATRQLDTSSFDSAVTMISPYQIEDEKDKVRIVIQLREAAGAKITESGKGLLVSIGANEATTAPPKVMAKEESPTPPESEATVSKQEPDQKVADKSVDKKEETLLDTYEKTTLNKHFTGRPITLQVKDADVQDILRLIGEASGFNVITSSSVAGKVSLALVDVPWDQVLDVVLSTMKLGAERSNNILRVMTLSELTTSKQEQMTAKAIAQQGAVRITKVFPISYAELSQISQTLQTFGKAVAQASSGVSNAVAPALVQSDSRTNSIIVQDIPENVERMKKLIEVLDTQTPQVLVEAKIVEASQNFSHLISGNMGLGVGPKGGRTVIGAGFNGSAVPNTTIGGTSASGASSAVSTVTATGTANAFSLAPSVGFLPGVQSLNALLSISEAEDSARIVSSPRVVVLHRESASIVQSQPILIESAVISGTSVQSSRTFQSANISLNVTPTVTNDESVMLQLSVSRDSVEDAGAGQKASAQRSINTKVLVDSGSTLVIGGVYTQDSRDADDGIPFLRKIPLLGHLFSNHVDSNNRRELFIFVTPRILNSKRAGLKTT